MVYPMQGYGYGGGYTAAQNTPQSFFANLQSKLQQGVIPGLQELGSTFPMLDPNSPQAEMLLQQTTQMLAQAGPEGAIRAQEFSVIQASYALSQVKTALMGMGRNADFSIQMQIQARASVIDNIVQQLQQKTFQLLDQDFAHGEQINLQPSSGGFSSMMGGMVQMMQLMLDTVMNKAS